jgi:flavin reductase (DIM6/NTAB) family NADH-FMN oxidoreductase RutF
MNGTTMIDFLLHTRADVDAGESPEIDLTAPLAAGESSFDQRRFRDALAQFTTGVTIVTAIAPDGSPRGFTANSFTSVSLNPPLVLACIDRGAHSYDAFTQGSGFAVNILSQDQRELSQRFASKSAEKFAGVAWSKGATGLPIIDGALAWLECRHWRRVTAGDHVVLIGEVVNLGVNSGQPLAYFGSSYGAVAPLDFNELSHP